MPPNGCSLTPRTRSSWNRMNPTDPPSSSQPAIVRSRTRRARRTGVRSVPGTLHSLDAVDERALEVVGLAGDAQRREPLADLVEHHRHLASGEVGAEAEVRASSAETDLCGVDRAGHVEPVGVGVDALVAISRVVEHHQFLALLHQLTADLGVLRGGAAEV